jgi:hypothetical protein
VIDMKRTILHHCASLCIVVMLGLVLRAPGSPGHRVAAQTPPAVPAAIVTPAEQPWDVKLYHAGASPLRFLARTRAATETGAALRLALSQAQAGDVVKIAAGDFDVSPNATYPSGLVWPNQVTIKGAGRYVTRLYGTINSDQQGGMFVVQNNDISDLTMEAIAAGSSTGTVFQQSDPRCLAFDFLGNVTATAKFLTKPPYHTRVTDCDIRSPAWGVYSWSDMIAAGGQGIANFLTMVNCDIYSGRHCVGGYCSGYGQDFRLYGCRMFGDPDDIFSVGAISQVESQSGVFGIVFMGGTLEAKNCTMRLKGRADYLDPDGGGSWSRTRRVCGITDSYGYPGSGPAGNTQINVTGLDCQITPNGSDPAQCFDLDLKNGFVQKQMRIPKDAQGNIEGCLGSAADGSLSKSY